MRSLRLAICVLLGFAAFTALGEAHAQSVRIVALGGSNAEGYGVGMSAAWPARLEELLKARGIAATVDNAGIRGQTSRELLARLDLAVPTGTRLVILDTHYLNDVRKRLPRGEIAATFAAIKAQMAAGKSASKSIEAAVPRDVVRAYWANVARIKARLAARKIGLLQVSTDTVGALLVRHPLGDGEHIDATGHAKLAGAILPQVLAAIRK